MPIWKSSTRGQPAILLEPLPRTPLLAGRLFGNAGRSAMKGLEEASELRKFTPGTDVFEPARVPRYAAMLIAGDVRMREENSGLERRVRPGEICGLTEMLGETPMNCRIEACSPVICKCIDHDAMVKVLQSEPDLLRQMSEAIAGRHLKAIRRATSR